MTSYNSLKITALQPCLRIDQFDYNIKQYRELFDQFADDIQISEVLCFPEYWNGLRKGVYSDNLNEMSIDFLKEIAITFSTWVIGGSHLVKDLEGDDERIFNRSHVFDPSGRLIGTYDKRHPFGYERFQEISPGKTELTWKIGDWNATIQICSDLWNTMDYSSLIVKNIDLIFSPILTTLPDSTFTNYGRFMWHNLAVIRAKEAAAAVVVSDSAMSPIREPYWCAGASCIVDPSFRFTNQEALGQRILTTIPDGNRGVVSVQLNLDKIRAQKNYRLDMGLLAINDEINI